MYLGSRAFRRMRNPSSWLVALGLLLGARAAPAETVHLVREGDTLGAIALRYGVSEQALRDANHLSEEALIRLGRKLVVPAPPAGAPALRKKGMLHLARGTETLHITVVDKKKRLLSAALPEISRLLRYPSGEVRPIEPRLVRLLAEVSDHFDGREIIVVSGFRPYSPTQYTPHSNHNVGKAVDFMVRGVANETVRDFCRTLRNVGVGYYPNSSFVHLDVRTKNGYWVDYAGSGQRPRYHRNDPPPLDPDEGAGEVPMDVASLSPMAPAQASVAPAQARGGGSSSTPTQTSFTVGPPRKKSEGSDSTGEPGLFPGRD
jgi:uncharacterized protein YcbK (DUF882 family)